MARGQIITKEKILEVRSAASRFPEMTQDELGKFTGLSKASVGRILAGEYDHIADEVKNDKAYNTKQLQEISEKLSQLESIGNDIEEMRTNLADLSDLVHVFCLMWADQNIVDSETLALWNRYIDSADSTFSKARVFGSSEDDECEDCEKVEDEDSSEGVDGN